MRILLFFILFLSHWNLSIAQDSISKIPCQIVRYELKNAKDTVLFDKERITELQNDPEFAYTIEKTPDNLWIKFKNWLYEWWVKLLKWLFDVEEVSGLLAILLEAIPYLLLIAVLGLVVWLFMKISPSTLYSEGQKNPEFIFTEDEDIIRNKNIQALINNAVTQKNYRLAIRYYYLSTLKTLKDRQLIVWESQKTNNEYLLELKKPLLRNQFEQLTHFYDFIWYGSFPIDESEFLRLEKAFKKIQIQIA